MNIKIADSWLREYLKTAAEPKKIAKCLSLCGASVERINKVNDDWVYDIEITSNRVDMASVIGIAREAAAALPQFGIKAKFVSPIPKLLSKKIPSSNKNSLILKIKSPELCPRFTAIVLENIKIKASPQIIQDRLIKSGMRPLNNIIDITNYLMKELGQPFHAFDWDKIKGHVMILRSSIKGEKITTLDNQNYSLPGNDIVIEDASRQIIDLCGIMGGSNSHIDKNTKKILLFVQTYNPVNIRRTSMILGKRTEAASLFEKAPDPEMVLPAIKKAIDLVEKLAQGKIASKLIDIYPNPHKSKTIKISLQLIKQYLGIPVQLIKVIKILQSLGFKTSVMGSASSPFINVTIPSWRANDVAIPQDIIEEVARIYGYHNLPSILPEGQLPERPTGQTFSWETRIKTHLADWGYTETYSYAMQSEVELKNCLLSPADHLKVANPLTTDWMYMRRSLIPSVLSIVAQNQDLFEQLKVFQMGMVYLKTNHDLPQERLHLVIAQTGKNQFFFLKGTLESLFNKINLLTYEFNPSIKLPLFDEQQAAQIICSGKVLGTMGKISTTVANNFKLKSPLTLVDLDFSSLMEHTKPSKTYQPISVYPPIIEDLTFSLNPGIYYTDLVNLIKAINPLISQINLIDTYKNNLTLRITYQSHHSNLFSEEVAKIRNAIITTVRQKGWGQWREKATG